MIHFPLYVVFGQNGIYRVLLQGCDSYRSTSNNHHIIPEQNCDFISRMLIATTIRSYQ